jgi:hypothetical protein
MTSLLKLAALGAVLTMAAATFSPAMAQERLCLRFDNKSLLDTTTEGEDAFKRAAAIGNRCFANYPRLNQSVTILPWPKGDTLNDADFYFLTTEQRRELGLAR